VVFVLPALKAPQPDAATALIVTGDALAVEPEGAPRVSQVA
jgi:hypothetical protein